jgi:phage-related protein
MQITFYTTAAGRNVVREYLNTLDLALKAAILEALEDVERRGFGSPGVRFRHLEGKLWEIKVQNQRILYTMSAHDRIVLVHAYKKQGRKLPKKERDIALRRMKEVLNEEKI